jgi:signal transduction histidine kinase
MTDKSGGMQDPDVSGEARLQATRARLFATADAERREIERSLHDGVQQDLIALAVKFQLARRLADSEPAAAQGVLDELGADIREALENVRLLSERIYPSVLGTRGVAEALRGLATVARISVRVETDGLGRYPPEVEEAVYFSCRAALEDAAARGAVPTVRIWQEDDALRFEVATCGGSAEPVAPDLWQIGDRIETLGGRVTLSSQPAGGTRVSAAIPLG